MNSQSVQKGFESLRHLKLQQVRSVIHPKRYQRSMLKAMSSYTVDALLYTGAIAGVILSPWPWLKLLFGVLAGCFVATMFCWGHDCAHGTVFRNRRIAEFFGTVFMLPSLNMYRLWIQGHNRVHHGFTSFSPIDWIWRPLTPEQYQAMPRYRRAWYHLERSLPFCALHYLSQVWWKGMVCYRPDPGSHTASGMRAHKLLTLLFALAFGSLLAWLGGGFWAVMAGLVVPFIVFNYFIALVVYLHHTHPDVPYFDQKSQWNPVIGHLYCTTVIRCSPIGDRLLHNILTHTPHHVDPAIPFYNLKGAARDLMRAYGNYLHEYRFSWRQVWRIFSQCKLYDFKSHTWHSFRQVKQAQRDQHKPHATGSNHHQLMMRPAEPQMTE